MCIGIRQRVARRDERERLRKHLVSTLDSDESQSHMQRRRAVHDRYGVRAAGVGRHALLELSDTGTDAGNEVRVDALNHIPALVAHEHGPVERDVTFAVHGADFRKERFKGR
jgi:hypothetical protein